MKNKLLKILSNIIKPNESIISLYDNRMYPDMIYSVLRQIIKPNSGLKYNKIILVYTHNGLKYSKCMDQVKSYNKKSILGLYYLLRSRVIFTDGYYGNELQNNGRILINLWHGVGLKKILAFTDTANKRYGTYTFSYSSYFDSVIAKAFNLDLQHVLTTGSPRNDLFYVGSRDDLRIINSNISQCKKVLIWMPTYRTSNTAVSSNDGKAYEFGIPLLDRDNINTLNGLLAQKNMYLIIKYHVLQNKNELFSEKFSNISIVTSEDIGNTGLSLYQLIGQCDGLITDYSSIYFEYMSLNKPICFAYDDYEEYDSKRGFMFENTKEIMPGVHATTIDELYAFISDISIDKDVFKHDREEMIQEMNLYCDGMNSYRLVKQLAECLYDQK